MTGTTYCPDCGQSVFFSSIDSTCGYCKAILFPPPSQPRVVAELTDEQLAAISAQPHGDIVVMREEKLTVGESIGRVIAWSKGNPRAQDSDQPYPAGDPLGRVYTPPSLARAHAQHVAVFFGCAPQVVLEPSVGRGDYLTSIYAVWPLARVQAVDIDKHAAGLVLDTQPWRPAVALCADFITAAHFWERLPIGKAYGYPDVILGNPPFGKEVGLQLTIDFIIAALELAKHQKGLVSFLLPLPYLCGQEFDEVWKVRRPRCIGRVRARPWPDRLREVCTMTWDMDGRDDDTSLVDIDWPREEA